MNNQINNQAVRVELARWRVSLDEFAQLLGITPEGVNRMLADELPENNQQMLINALRFHFKMAKNEK